MHSIYMYLNAILGMCKALARDTSFGQVDFNFGQVDLMDLHTYVIL